MPNTTTNPQNNQGHPPLTHDRAKAALGNATLLQSFLLPPHTAESKQAHMVKTGQIQPQTPEVAPQEVKPQETAKEPTPKMDTVELTLTKKIDDLAKEIKDSQKTEMENMRLMIQQALTQEDDKETTSAKSA